MKKILLFLIITSFLHSYSQVIFEKHYDKSGVDIGYCMQVTDDNKYVITGQSNGRVFLMITDSIGNEEVYQEYDGENGNTAYSIEKTFDNGFIITGWTKNTDGKTNVYLLKTDALGNMIWSKSIGNDSDDESAWSVKETNDHGYITAGVYNNYDVYVVRADLNGDTIWTKRYGGNDQDAGYAITLTNDDGFIVTGVSNSFDSFHAIYVFKANFNGDILWSNTYQCSNNFINSGSEILQTNDNGFIITGRTSESFTSQSKPFLLKIDSVGNQTWLKTYSYEDATSYSVIETNDNGFILCGGSRINDQNDAFILKTDSNGDSLWTMTFGGTSNDYFSSAQEISGNNLLFAGYTSSFGAEDHDIYLVKLGINSNNTSLKEAYIKDNFLCYPNPTNGRIYIKETNVEDVFVFDVYGRLIFSGNQEIDLSNYSDGIYFVKIRTGKQIIIEKIIKQ